MGKRVRTSLADRSAVLARHRVVLTTSPRACCGQRGHHEERGVARDAHPRANGTGAGGRLCRGGAASRGGVPERRRARTLLAPAMSSSQRRYH